MLYTFIWGFINFRRKQYQVFFFFNVLLWKLRIFSHLPLSSDASLFVSVTMRRDFSQVCAILLLFYGIIYCYYNYYVEGLIILFCNYYELFSLSSRRRDSVLTSSVYLLHSIFLRSWFWIFSWLDIFQHWVEMQENY